MEILVYVKPLYIFFHIQVMIFSQTFLNTPVVGVVELANRQKSLYHSLLDVSGVHLDGNLLVVKKAGDKGFSAGEKSFGSIKIIRVFDSEIGVAVKDSSIIELNELESEKVRLDIAVFNKKKLTFNIGR